MKYCSRCQETKAKNGFYRAKRKSDGCSCYCKKCSKEIRKVRYASDPERFKAEAREHRIKNPYQPHPPGWWRDREYQKKYGISIADYDRMFARQSGCCSICQKQTPGVHLHIDHNHETGNVRSLLCLTCNAGLGHFRDDVGLLKDAIKYLRRHAVKLEVG